MRRYRREILAVVLVITGLVSLYLHSIHFGFVDIVMGNRSSVEARNVEIELGGKPLLLVPILKPNEEQKVRVNVLFRPESPWYLQYQSGSDPIGKRQRLDVYVNLPGKKRVDIYIAAEGVSASTKTY